jgi:cytidyltransferase-like protein
MWQKKTHIHSSLEKKEKQYDLFIGRFQPLHFGHQQMFQQVLDKGGNICIAIRDSEVNEKNPFTTTQVYANISDHYKDLIEEGRVKVIKIPDICSVSFGRGVGYDIVEYMPPTEIAEISATKIREQMK